MYFWTLDLIHVLFVFYFAHSLLQPSELCATRAGVVRPGSAAAMEGLKVGVEETKVLSPHYSMRLDYRVVAVGRALWERTLLPHLPTCYGAVSRCAERRRGVDIAQAEASTRARQTRRCRRTGIRSNRLSFHPQCFLSIKHLTHFAPRSQQTPASWRRRR